MDIFANLRLGFSTALSLANLFYCFIGVVLGTLIGDAARPPGHEYIAMLLPVTFSFQPVTALIMLAGIFYGACTAARRRRFWSTCREKRSSVITALDGHAM